LFGYSAFAFTALTGLDLSEATALETIPANVFDGTALAGTTVINIYQIPSHFARETGTTLTGILKVGPVVTSIGSNAFAGTDLTGLDLSEATALVTIGISAFYYATKLTGTLKVGPAVTSIGFYAFSSNDLTGLDLSEATALQTIGEWAFYKNQQLTGTLKVGPAVTSIGSNAFYDTDLTGLDLSEATALVTIGDSAFGATALAGTTVTGANGRVFSL
jgi:uncharacterized protein YjbI with pentapeptide repeats